MYWNDLAHRGLWGPFRDLERLRDQMNRIFRAEGNGDGEVAPTAEFPALNIFNGDEGVAVTAELPGLDAKDLDVSVVGETLTLKGTRPPEQPEKGAIYHRQERGAGQFIRNVALGFAPAADGVDAHFSKGVLTVDIKRPVEERPRKITVKAR